jgi:RNA polymerase sigma-70 factor (ECF subfamily)
VKQAVDIEADDDALLGALRRGEERVFRELVERWSGVMLRLALSQVQSRDVAEDVVQDAWLTVLRSLDRFERRSTLRTWVLGIVVNLARSRARAERRWMPLPDEPAGPVIDQARFLPADHPRWPSTGRWSPSSGVRPRRICSPARPGR